MLPEILKNANTPEGGARILDKMGVEKSFIDESYNKYSKYLSKIPGMNATNTKHLLDMVKGAMRGSSNTTSGIAPQSQNSSPAKPIFDRSKYPKV